jgi:hypothetical protein
MQCSKSLGYLAYPLLMFSLFAAPLLQAQTTSDPAQAPAPSQSPAPPQSPAQSPAPGQAPTQDNSAPGELVPQSNQPQQEQPPASSSASQENHPGPQDRVRLAREAQERVRARRQQRLQAVVQDTYSHKYEVYFGYGYLRVRPGHSLQHATEYGWNAGITDFIRPKIGLTADFRGYYTNAFTGNGLGRPPAGSGADPSSPVQGLFNPFISNYAVQLGGQYAVRQRRNYAVSGQLLAGVTRTLFFANSSGLPGRLVGLYPNQTRFTLTGMVPLDYNLGPGLAVRIAPTYNLTTWGGDIQHNLGFTLGLNYRFGRQ